MESLRLAPSTTQPIGIPYRSVAIDHFQPVLARSVGLGPVPSAPQGGFVQAGVDGGFGQVQADDLVVAGERFFDRLGEHAGLEPFGAPVAQGGLACGAQSCCDVQEQPVTSRSSR